MRICNLAVALAFLVLSMMAGTANAEYIKAVTYFGNAWPINYWNSNTEIASRDFARLRDEGFNAVVLVVPWGEFQPGLDPIRFNDAAYGRLKRVCEAAKASNMQVHMRVSYLWDYYPGKQVAPVARAESLLSHDELLPAWRKYLARINESTQGCATGSFISWEDYWSIIDRIAAVKSGNAAASLSREIGFDSWIRKNATRSYLDQHADEMRRFGAYLLPGRRSPDFKYVFQWFDAQLMTRLMPVLSSQLSNASIEARVDDDPIFDGDKLVDWYSHKKTYLVPSSPFVMTYWAPAMGARNQGEFEPADAVLKRFSYMQQKIMSSTTNKIFIGQLLFTDNTPSAVNNASLVPGQIGKFIQSLSGPLVRQTSGYALWGARDYDASLIFNGFFALGDLGWDFSGGASVVNVGREQAARLPFGSRISQLISYDRDHFRSFAKSTSLRLAARGPGVLLVNYAGSSIQVDVPASMKLIKLDLPVAGSDDEISISGLSGTVEVTSVHLYTFTQLFGVRDALGNPGPRLPDIVALNRAIDQGGGIPSRLGADDMTLREASGVHHPEKSGSDWVFWASPVVSVRIIPRSSIINVRGYVKTSMFHHKTCAFEAFVDDARTASIKFASDGLFELAVPVPVRRVGGPVDLRLASSCSLNPKTDRGGSDDRNLSYILKEIDSRPNRTVMGRSPPATGRATGSAPTWP